MDKVFGGWLSIEMYPLLLIIEASHHFYEAFIILSPLGLGTDMTQATATHFQLNSGRDSSEYSRGTLAEWQLATVALPNMSSETAPMEQSITVLTCCASQPTVELEMGGSDLGHINPTF